MSLNKLTPILIIGFNRPLTLSSLLSKVESLESREILISLDGPRPESDGLNALSTRDVADSWANTTHHDVKVVKRSENLGIYNHFTQALTDFFDQFEFGIILEDDIDFRYEFVSYVDEHQIDLISNKYWSICGHNPGLPPNHDHSNLPVAMRETYVHTIWGWATGKDSFRRYLDFLKVPSEETIATSLAAISRKITRDPFLRLGIEATWRRKMLRALKSSNQSGWDNFWLVAGWSSGLVSLLPCCSISTEVNYFDEGQTHPHQVDSSPLLGLPTEIVFSENSTRYRVGSDVALLNVWGITRLYCWIFVLRLIGRK